MPQVGQCRSFADFFFGAIGFGSFSFLGYRNAVDQMPAQGISLVDTRSLQG